ncbi:MAG: hypothetical protein HYZ52_04825 [Candidatus Omnitrophica bacterium]|nr:hypothetical protein [Candidatus Omnitrophota bacterium]
MKTRAHLKYAFFLLTAALFYCRDWIFSGRPLLEIGGDLEQTYYSSLVYFHEWVRRGVFPLWNTLSLCGQPYGFHSVSRFDFYHWAAFFLDPLDAFSLVRFLALFLNGLCFYLFLVRKSVSRFGACLGALVWMITMGRSVESGLFLLPLSFLLADRYAASFKKADFVALTAALVLFLLNANPQHFLYDAIFLVAYLLTQFRPVKIKVLFLPFFFAGGLCLFHFVPQLELALHSSRHLWNEVQALSPVYLPTAVFPKWFESPSRPDLNFMVPRLLEKIYSRVPILDHTHSFAPLPYMGLFSVFAVWTSWGCWKRKASGGAAFFLAGAGTVLVFLMLNPLLDGVFFRFIPLVSGMTNVVRLFDVYRFCLAALCGIAFDDRVRHANEGHLKKMAAAWGALVGLFFAGLFVLRLMVFRTKDALVQTLGAYLEKSAASNLFIGDPAAFKNRRIGDFFDFLNQATSVSNPHLIGPICFTAALFILFFIYAKKIIGERPLWGLLTMFVLIDLGGVSGFTMPSVSRAEMSRYQPVADFLLRDKDLFRVLSVEDGKTSFSRMFLRPETNVSYGIATPDGYEQLYQERYVRFYARLSQRDRDPVSILHATETFNRSLADFANCKYLLTSAANPVLDGKEGYRKIYEGFSHKIYLNEKAMPRAFVARHLHYARNRQEAEDFINAPAEKLKDTVVLEGAPELGEEAAGDPSSVNVCVYRPDFVRIRTDLSRPGFLVLSDVYYPGWKAVVDGGRVPIYWAQTAFRAVLLDRGRHTVEFIYEPLSLKIGAGLSLFFLLGLGFYLARIDSRYVRV